MIAVDTNVLLYAHRAGCPDAVILPPPAAIVPRCLQLAEQMDLGGPRVFDLQIGLTALEAGVSEIWTHDAGFVGLPGLLVRDPLQPGFTYRRRDARP